VFALSGLGGENGNSTVKVRDGIKKFEKHCLKRMYKGLEIICIQLAIPLAGKKCTSCF